MEIKVQMARATAEDVRKVIDFFETLEAFFGDGLYQKSETEHGQGETEHGQGETEHGQGETERRRLNDSEVLDILREMWGGPGTRERTVDSAWFRVVFGYSTLVEACCKPDSDVLELRDDWAFELGEPEGLEKILDKLVGPREALRSVLTNKRRIVEKLCAHAEHVSRIRNVEPWTVISKILLHGQGVSQAIYDLYRWK